MRLCGKSLLRRICSNPSAPGAGLTTCRPDRRDRFGRIDRFDRHSDRFDSLGRFGRFDRRAVTPL